MFGFSCNYSPNSLITQCVDSILKYHPDDKIVITDSQSEDKSYYEQYIGCENIIILDNLNKRLPNSNRKGLNLLGGADPNVETIATFLVYYYCPIRV